MVDAIIRGTVERGPRRDPAAAKALPIGMRIMWRVVGGDGGADADADMEDDGSRS